MADENEGGGGLNLQRKIGPLPLYAWVMIAGGVGLIIFKLMGSKSATGASGGPGAGTQFSSSTTSTNPQTGVSTSYTASGDGYLPGQLTFQAGPMPYSGGDIYINTPAPTNTTTPGGPPNEVYNPGGADAGPEGGETYGRSEIAAIQKLVGQYGYTQNIVDDVQAAYNAEVTKNGQAIADAQHYSWLGPSNVQAIPRHLTAQNQITTGLPNNPVWGQAAPQALTNNPTGTG